MNMEFNYDKYPMILFTSFDKEDSPPVLPFEVLTEDIRQYLENSPSFSELFSMIAVKNTLRKENQCTYYSLDEKLFTTVDSNAYFRDRYFPTIFRDYIKPKNGVIIFPDGGQYVYMFLGEKETGAVKRKKGRYIAAALFKENVFIGWEEGYLLPNGIAVEPGGFYGSGMDVGGYLSFVMVTLAYAGEKQYPILQTDMKENIYHLT